MNEFTGKTNQSLRDEMPVMRFMGGLLDYNPNGFGVGRPVIHCGPIVVGRNADE